ncbi:MULTISPECIES: aldehyde dehydrogenase family protein [unclassified Halomonas]|uniref:aldehyde dehydrogenase family protein n=1 Tax=unclassified Halomonas TaxID=2609666 RepID=UPI0028875EA8|nr:MULTISPECIES: aldehyde dehydrogenase family protein [unclassified Halomonas]MDT0502310.1 aldehyde dehydrogenase family protein [Halomonas sp. PAR7]MDT0511752.1 aldehyde dehydrogenase family protein [Halomonas sp. LES1]MDT0592085.1 aldehyde dehydrogenase family protein [Halomonas sp. PAR8]
MSHVHSLYINGTWVEGQGSIANVNPSDTSDIVGDYAQASVAQVGEAISAARQGQKQWARTGLEHRYGVLMAIGDELIARKAELGELLAREEGKTLAEGMGEVHRSGQFFHYYGAEVLRQIDERAESVRPGVEVDIRREPVGVVGIISPWNFPMATAVWKIAPALAFGNAVVFKPANLVPASAWALTEIISRQELPAGTFNLIMGSGGSVGDALISSPEIHAVSFTGSLEVGRRVAAATAANLVKCQLEMGSKNALIVADDADLDLAVEAAFNGAYSGTGQKCTASSRLIVTEKVHDAFVEKLIKRLEQVKVGHALEEGVSFGPAADARQLESNLAWVERAQREGARLAFGGERLERDTDGYFMAPTLFVDTTNDMPINREEVFGPIACVIKVADADEAIEVLNDTHFGLTAGIITDSLALASEFKARAETGCVMVNLATAGTDYHVPFGGRKNSSFGPREQGRYAREFYTVVKTCYVKAN